MTAANLSPEFLQVVYGQTPQEVKTVSDGLVDLLQPTKRKYLFLN